MGQGSHGRGGSEWTELQDKELGSLSVSATSGRVTSEPVSQSVERGGEPLPTHRTPRSIWNISEVPRGVLCPPRSTTTTFVYHWGRPSKEEPSSLPFGVSGCVSAVKAPYPEACSGEGGAGTWDKATEGPWVVKAWLPSQKLGSGNQACPRPQTV